MNICLFVEVMLYEHVVSCVVGCVLGCIFVYKRNVERTWFVLNANGGANINKSRIVVVTKNVEKQFNRKRFNSKIKKFSDILIFIY